MKKALFIVLVILLVLALVPVSIHGCECMVFPNPPMPEITYGEFPFKLVYEKNGEKIVVEDTIICKFDGVKIISGHGKKVRKWKAYLDSGQKSPSSTYSAALLIDDTNAIYFSLGSPYYYMGDGNCTLNFHAFRLHKYPLGGHLYPYIGDIELLITYGIKLISFELSAPIVNTFK